MELLHLNVWQVAAVQSIINEVRRQALELGEGDELWPILFTWAGDLERLIAPARLER